MKKDEVVSSNHITIHEYDKLDPKIKMAKTPETLEDGGRLLLMIRKS